MTITTSMSLLAFTGGLLYDSRTIAVTIRSLFLRDTT